MAGHNDDKGYQRGAKGIDGKKDEGFQNKGRDQAAEHKMYGPIAKGSQPYGEHGEKFR